MWGKWPGLPYGITDRLAFRLLVLLSMALLPLGAISINATVELRRTAQTAGERSLIALAADVVSGQRALVESALASTRAIESLVLERLDNSEACRELLQDYGQRSYLYSFIGFIDPDGTARCDSGGRAFHIGDSPEFERLRSAPITTITAGTGAGSPAGPGRLPVVIVARPVFQDGTLLGFLSISITRRSMELLGQRLIEGAPQASVLINHDGAVLSYDPDSPEMELLPAAQPLPALVAQGGSRVFRDASRAGDQAVYALAELVPRRLYTLAMWEKGAPQLQVLETSRLPLLFPAAMWLASLAVVLLSIHYLVLRHLKGLSRQMRRFALGKREPWPDLPGQSPSEIRDLHGTFRNMARLIARDEDEREKSLAEKTMLLKELHHRVKNNLQLIASIINLQMRQLADPAARRVLHNVQERVLGLATVHRVLYGEGRLTRVRADRVVADILGRVAMICAAPGTPPRLRLQLTPLVLDADRMVPLSFLLNEAVTNALKHMGTTDGSEPWIEVELLHEPAATDAEASTDTGPPAPGMIVLRLRNPLPARTPPAPEGADGGLGHELIEAFAMQLGGSCRQAKVTDPERGPVWELELHFPTPPDAVVQAEPEDSLPATAAAS